VDLSTYRSPGGNGAAAGSPPSPAGGPASSAVPGSYTRAVTEATFQADVLEQSMTVPVVLDLWATWCEPCKQLSPVLERLADEYGGRFVLATIDIDAEQRIAAALQVQSIPAVFGVIRGQPVPLFTGAVPEQQIRQVLEELLGVSVENGLTATAEPVPGPGTAGTDEGVEASAEPPEDPRMSAVYDAVEAGDYDTAAQLLRSLLAADPGFAEAVAGLAQVNLLARTTGRDADADLAAADQAPQNLPAGLAAADADFVRGEVSAAFDRLVGLVRASAGAERNGARSRLLELFDVLGSEDPRVGAARIALANALF